MMPRDGKGPAAHGAQTQTRTTYRANVTRRPDKTQAFRIASEGHRRDEDLRFLFGALARDAVALNSYATQLDDPEASRIVWDSYVRDLRDRFEAAITVGSWFREGVAS